MTPTEWADLASYRFERYGPVGKLLDEQDWQPWAAQLCALPQVRDGFPPDPTQFLSFETWAEAFDQIIDIGD